MKNTCVLKFSSLAELANFVKTIQPEGYTINTVKLTLTAPLRPFEHAVALDTYNAEEVKTFQVNK